MSLFKRLRIFLLLTALSLAGLFCVSLLQRQMSKIITANRLTDTDIVENAPPVIAFTTVALGSFRGLLADILWLRAIRLQDEGNYYEMAQLASWITKLQPRFTGATAYLAWNMAYNISVTCSLPEDRWRWVSRGIELIRDEALSMNPSDPLLYKELGWIYQHKVGNILDDANLYYKNQLALDMMKVFGSAEPDWQAWAAAPRSAKEFDTVYPPDSPVRKAMEAAGFKSVKDLETEFRSSGGVLPQKLADALGGPALVKNIETYLRASWLRAKFKLDAAMILKINNKFGPLDWRLPEAQAIYWAEMGLEKSPNKADISCERMITQSLKDAFMGGKLLLVDKDNFKSVITVPNLGLADAVRDTYQKAYERNKSNSFKSALMNYMKDATVILYNFGNYTKAREYYDWMRKEEPGNNIYRGGLDQFVLREWTEDVQSANLKQANDIVAGLLYRACYLFAYGDVEAAMAHQKLAALVYTRYQSDQSGALGRTGLAPFNQIKKNVTENCLKNFPPSLAEILKKQIDAERKKAKEDSPAQTPAPSPATEAQSPIPGATSDRPEKQ
jgi:hypothetical protein